MTSRITRKANKENSKDIQDESESSNNTHSPPLPSLNTAAFADVIGRIQRTPIGNLGPRTISLLENEQHPSNIVEDNNNINNNLLPNVNIGPAANSVNGKGPELDVLAILQQMRREQEQQNQAFQERVMNIVNNTLNINHSIKSEEEAKKKEESNYKVELKRKIQELKDSLSIVENNERGYTTYKVKEEMPHLDIDPFDDPDRYMQELSKSAQKNSRQAPTAANALLDELSSSGHVMDAVLNSFNVRTRAMMKMLKQPGRLSFKEKNTEMDRMIKSLKMFGGKTETAPSWFQEYCMAVGSIDLTTQDCIKILRSKMEDQAKPWLDGLILRIATLNVPDHHILSVIFADFRKMYMGVSVATQLRKRLTDIKLSDSGLNITELKHHYSNFTTAMNNLRILEPDGSEASYKQMYVDAMPPSIRTFMGMSPDACTTVDLVYALAETAVNAIKGRLKPLDPDTVNANVLAVNNVSLNALPMKNKNTTNRATKAELTPQQQYTNLNMSKVNCWHCGKVGHWTADCRLLAAGTSQTTLGAIGYASFCKTKGEFIPYPERLKQLIANKAKFNENNTNHGTNPSNESSTTANQPSPRNKRSGRTPKNKDPKRNEKVDMTVLDDSESDE